MSNWNSRDFASHTRIAGRDYRCDVCGGWIYKGEQYDSTYGGRGKEHTENCPGDLTERLRRECRTN